MYSEVESTDDWVPLIDWNHVLRRDIDWIVDLNPFSGSTGGYEPVSGYARDKRRGWQVTAVDSQSC